MFCVFVSKPFTQTVGTILLEHLPYPKLTQTF